MTPDDISAAWLSDALGAPVDAVECDPIGVGVGLLGDLVRARLTSSDASLPPSVIVKLPTHHEANRAIGLGLMLYERELRFYEEIAPQSPSLRVPRCWHADHESLVLVLEDIGASGYSLADQVAGMTVEQAERAIDAIATFHASWWETPALHALDWLPTSDHPITMQSDQMFQDAWPVFREKWEHVLPSGSVELGERVRHAYGSMLGGLGGGPHTVVHTDFRLDNLFFGDDVAVIDWQLMTRSKGPYDIGYLVAQSMDVDLRRAHATTLLRRWYDGVCELGVTGYSWEEAEADFAAAVLVALVIPVNAGATIELGNERGEDLIRSISERGFGAALDVDYEAVLKPFE
jgi:hypothetical protein